MSAVKLSAVSTPQAARLLTFDTEHFGIRIGMAEHPDVDEWAAENAVGCLFLLLDMTEVDAIQSAERRGFFATDVRVELAAKTKRSGFNATLREVEPRDLPALVAIARSSHRITRFYADEHFSRDKCDDLYEAWIRNSVDGWADKVFVYGSQVTLGYVTVHLDLANGVASIGLIAVHETARGQGIGSLLCKRALAWAHSQGALRMTTVTQGRNVAALRMFEANGFKVERVGLWMHKWWTER